MNLPGTPEKRDRWASVLGFATALAGGFFIYQELVPWYAGCGMIGVGLYLMLPRRMRKLGDFAVATTKTVRGK